MSVNTEFTFEKIYFESPYTDPSIIELSGAVAVFEAREDMRYPFVTAYMTLVDDQDFVSTTKISGGEKVYVLIKAGIEGSNPTFKVFYISKIKMSSKVGERSETYIFELIEDIAYQSNLFNINRVYTGKCDHIIEKINEEYLPIGEAGVPRQITKLGESIQDIKTIVPNLTPLQTMSWITDRATTTEGFPFYLFSSFRENKLFFCDLGTLLTQRAPETNKFTYSNNITNHPLYNNRKAILAFEQNDVEDLFALIQRGLIGANYEFIHPIKNEIKTFQFDIFKDLLSKLDNIVHPDQKDYLYGPLYQFKGQSYNKIPSRNITRIGGNSVFQDTRDQSVKSYRENIDAAEYKAEVISRAMKDLIVKAPVTVGVNGVDFIAVDEHSTIGNVIRLEFLSSYNSNEVEYNKRLTGDYIIYGAQHTFVRDTNKYNLKLSCVKLSNLNPEH